MDECVDIKIPLDLEDVTDKQGLQKVISNSIMEYGDSFLPLLERKIDLGDMRTSVIEGTLKVEYCDVVITSTECFASATFDSFYYAGCKDMDSYNDHEITLPFTIEDNILYFNIELPPPWRPDEHGM